jgi:hypothetical protein
MQLQVPVASIGLGRRPGEGGNDQDGSIHVLLVEKLILSLLGGKDFGMDGDALCLGHDHAPSRRRLDVPVFYKYNQQRT